MIECISLDKHETVQEAKEMKNLVRTCVLSVESSVSCVRESNVLIGAFETRTTSVVNVTIKM